MGVSGVIADEIMLKFGDDGSEEYAKLSAMGRVRRILLTEAFQ